MATEILPSTTGEAAILSRLIRPDDDQLTAEAAESLLRIRFDRPDLDRIHELTTKNQEDKLSPGERDELDSYIRVSFLLDLMHSKARRALKKHRPGR